MLAEPSTLSSLCSACRVYVRAASEHRVTWRSQPVLEEARCICRRIVFVKAIGGQNSLGPTGLPPPRARASILFIAQVKNV
jgi:hypothetical protein